MKNDVRRFRIAVDVEFGCRRRIPGHLGGATHENDPAHPCNRTRIPARREGKVGQRPEGDDGERPPPLFGLGCDEPDGGLTRLPGQSVRTPSSGEKRSKTVLTVNGIGHTSV
jgi:hypothetical protein